MSNCTEISLSSAEYCDSYENELSGIEADVLIWPCYTVAYNPADGIPLMISNVEPIVLPCILEKTDAKITSRKGSFDSDIKIWLQNTAHNRGVISALRKTRFYTGVKEAGKSVMQIFGYKDDTCETNQLAAKVKDDSVLIDFGTEFGSDKYIELVISSVLKLPKQAVGKLVSEEFSRGGYISGAISAYSALYNDNAVSPFNVPPSEIYINDDAATLDTELGQPILTEVASSEMGLTILAARFNALLPNGDGYVIERLAAPDVSLPFNSYLAGEVPNVFSIWFDREGWRVQEFAIFKTPPVGPEIEIYRIVIITQFRL